jgi:DNA-binding PadR family transcriptional regulator
MKPKKDELPDEILRLIPLSPAVFFCLFALADGAKHGYAMMQETRTLSGGKFRMGPGTLYSTIQRLLDLDLIEEIPNPPGEKIIADDRRRYYKLTDSGQRLLNTELARMRDVLQLATERTLCRS